MTDKWPVSGGMTTFGRRSFAITPNDTNDLEEIPKAVSVTVAGTLSVVPHGNEDADVVAYDEVPVGFTPPFLVRRVMDTGTTATVVGVTD